MIVNTVLQEKIKYWSSEYKDAFFLVSCLLFFTSLPLVSTYIISVRTAIFGKDEFYTHGSWKTVQKFEIVQIKYFPLGNTVHLYGRNVS